MYRQLSSILALRVGACVSTPLSLEEFKHSVVGNDIYLITNEFVLPLEEGFEYCDGFHL